jgi:hypothetical protein
MAFQGLRFLLQGFEFFGIGDRPAVKLLVRLLDLGALRGRVMLGVPVGRTCLLELCFGSVKRLPAALQL